MSTTRDIILKTLKARGACTIAELGEALGVSLVSVRHHLSSLQADGLVKAQEVRHGVGRPHLVYSLTEAGLERFPSKYVALSGRLLDTLKATMTPEVIEAMFAKMAATIADDIAPKLNGKPLEERMSLLVELLGEEGFMARWNVVGETYQLTEYNCPYFRIGQKHPEVCRLDETLISRVLDLPVEKHTCLLNGDEHCTFTIIPTERVAA